jgi:hypothetical protein
VIDPPGWAGVSRIALLSASSILPYFFRRGFSATTKKARLRGNPSVGLTVITGSFDPVEKLRELGLSVPFTGFDASTNVEQFRLPDWRATTSVSSVTYALF